jgi:hypothetical protein
MKQPLPVWPYYALAVIAGAVGGVLLYFNLGTDFPEQEDLQKISGTIDKVLLVDDVSGEPTIQQWPITSVHFTLENVDGEFRYPNSWPGYTDVYDRLGFDVDVWVSRADTQSGEAMLVYALRQHVPENWIAEPISVSYAQIVELQGRSGASYVRVGAYLLAAAGGLVLGAFGVRAINRRRDADSRALTNE